jgi:DNA-binding FadR family transcriptional regulator
VTRRVVPPQEDAASARVTQKKEQRELAAADLAQATQQPDQADGSFLAGLEQPANRKLAAGIADDIERYIISRGWPVGEVIFSEAELMQRYNASRSIIREAARLLEQHTTARMRKGRGGGLVVTTPDVGPVTNIVAVFLEYESVTPSQLFEARVALELTAVELATERLSEADIGKLRQAIDAERAVSLNELWQHTHDIHVAIAEVAKSPAFPLFVTVLTKLVDARATRRASQVRAPDVYQAHSAIVEAIIAGDASLARHRMRRHLEAITPYLR